ncbi:protocadherin gamma subfamily A, 3 L homeolog isoform X34 [Xenopus laevis]|uniref:Protocadherin gamma subfamily A, 3 L homeolog isoform X34 n=1 Tax=Xenopus laevis TaxID=8355 RepID=A0A8J1MGK7_XENLA|nr:protocadherin gamma subfamily A, 3 L homeolog isoform X34 [Xenopus laevis]
MDSIKAWKWQVMCSFFLCSWGWVSGQLHYSVAEESAPGTLVGNIAHDLGLKQADINQRRLSLGSEENSQYFFVDQKTGALTVNERIDRESLCGSILRCVLLLEIVIEDPLELLSVEVEILDINDNYPVFSNANQVIKITELLTSPGVRFPLEIAQDADVGINGISQYRLNPDPNFSLSVTNRKDGTLIAELILEKILDREESKEHKLTLTAFDGGEQARTGSSQVTITILDINDNPPVFDQPIYKIKLQENLPLKSLIIKLNATDIDEGTNGEIQYSFDHHTLDSAKRIFDLHPDTGEIFIKGIVDYEELNFIELSVKAVDKGLPKLEGRCLIQVEVEDANDNTPEILFTSKTNNVPENAPLGTIVGFITVKDKDSGKNGEIQLILPPYLPFRIQPFKSRYTLVTSEYLDREKISQYTIELVASDLGSPPLINKTVIVLNISDINDNAPVFAQSMYSAYIKENNEPGTLLCTVSAFDVDEGSNSNLDYSIAETQVYGSTIASFVYINSNTGQVYAQSSFDYEQFQVLQITAKVQDLGSPQLYSNASIFIFVLDTNDNKPSLLYPETSVEFSNKQEKLSKSASAGYYVTKLSAVDLDSGHNAWLTYTILESTTPTLFEISSYTGEVRTVRSVQETDSTEQSLVISISDHGEPTLSTTVTIFINIADNTEQEIPKSQELLKNPTSTDLTLYLIISLVAISLVSLVTFTILLFKCLKKDGNGENCGLCFSVKSQPNNYLDQYKPTLYLNTDGTLKYMEVRMTPAEQGQCYQTCFPMATEPHDFIFTKPLDFSRSTEPSSDSRLLTDPIQAQPNADWRFSQAAQKPGPSGTQPTEEAGVWPNNQFETERLQAMILASANEAAEGTSGLGGGTGTMGLSARYGPQFTLQHVPDYRQNVYIPGSTLTPTNGGGKREGKGNKKKSSKKDKK